MRSTTAASKCWGSAFLSQGDAPLPVTPSSTLDSGLANQSTASPPPIVMGSEVPLRPHQSPWGAIWGLGETGHRKLVFFLLDFILGGQGMCCWPQYATTGHLRQARAESRGKKQREPSNDVVSAPESSCACRLLMVHKSVNAHVLIEPAGMRRSKPCNQRSPDQLKL